MVGSAAFPEMGLEFAERLFARVEVREIFGKITELGAGCFNYLTYCGNPVDRKAVHHHTSLYQLKREVWAEAVDLRQVFAEQVQRAPREHRTQGRSVAGACSGAATATDPLHGREADLVPLKRSATPRCDYQRSFACASPQRFRRASGPIAELSTQTKRPRVIPAARCCPAWSRSDASRRLSALHPFDC